MNVLLRNRARLIRALINSKKAIANAKSQVVIESIIGSIRSDKDGHFVSTTKPTSTVEISYCRKGTKSMLPADRVLTTFGRYLRRGLQINADVFSDAEVDILCKTVGKEMFDTKEIERNMKILTGNAVQEHYSKTDTHSCMTRDQSWKVNIYALNPDKVSLLVYNNKIRALLWTCDDGTKVLDRIYPAGCVEIEYIRKWAEIKGYVLRVNADRAPQSNICEELSDKSIHSVTMKYNSAYPYIDTFRFAGELDLKKKTVVLSNSKNYFVNKGKKYYESYETDGRIPWRSATQSDCDDEEDTITCCDCGHELDEADVCHNNAGNIYCLDCYNEHYFCCDDCERETSVDYKNHIADADRYVCDGCTGNYHYCEKCNIYFKNDSYEVEDHGVYCEGCFIDYGKTCEHCEKHILNKNALKHDGQCYCDECYDQLFADCNSCGETYPKEDLEEIDGECYCEDCNEKV